VTERFAARFESLTTAHLADACIRAGVPVRCAPAGLRGIRSASRFAGRALPATHVGSVDVFLEAIDTASPGDVLVADNGGRLDESCIGDLLAGEAQSTGLAGIVIWGLHRDTVEVREIGIPVFSLGSIPTGPLRADARPETALEQARVGEWVITRNDFIAADVDGIVFLPFDKCADVFELAETIRDTEQRQAIKIRDGISLRQQVRFADFLEARRANPELTFREHLRTVGGEIEV
jgi:regulator of RNase E activity RraA